MKNFKTLLLFVICLTGLLSCKKEAEISVIEKIKGNYELNGGFEYKFTDEPTKSYKFTHPTTKISVNKVGTTEIQLAMPYLGTGLVLAEQTTSSVFELKNANTKLNLTKDGVNFETYSLKLTGKVSIVDNTVFVKIIGKDELKNLIVTYDYTGIKNP